MNFNERINNDRRISIYLFYIERQGPIEYLFKHMQKNRRSTVVYSYSFVVRVEHVYYYKKFIKNT
jgi:hypothetical protein